MREPMGAPDCWSKQFDDGDDECKNCSFNMSCRPAMINNAAKRVSTLPQAPQYSLPVMQQQQQYAPRFSPPAPQAQAPLPQPSAYPRTVFQPSPPTSGPQAPVGYQPHAPPGWNMPVAYLPRPNPPGGAWWQYQGESTGTRLGKNILLTALQAIFSELLRFFTNWTWPARLGTV